MSFEFLIAKRYLLSKRRHPFVGVGTFVSVAGICVGVAALIVVMSVMNGFDQELKSKMIGVRAHVIVTKENGFDHPAEFCEVVRKINSPKVKGAVPFIEGQALIQSALGASGALVRGVDVHAEKNSSDFFKHIILGTMTAGSRGTVLGSELAKKYNIQIGAEISLLSQNSKKPEKFTVEGIYSCGIYDYDANLVFIDIAAAQKLFALGDNVSGVSIFLANADKASDLKSLLQKKLSSAYFTQTWEDMNKTFFSALKLEKTVMFLILSLIIFVACLNIAGSLTMLVMDKTKDIGVLKALGAKPSSFVKIFSIDGLLIGSVGSFTGMALGLILCWVLAHFSFIDLPADVYYFTKLPVRVSFPDVFLVSSVAVLLSLLSSVYPAVCASQLQTVKALRYE